ncbi:hypothetical protein LJR225_000225 [Phenylobacterium sp. LjRoot225]|uniref:DUF6683 family protein n=1 Tax=Phenylobacterium sp. LjRoot225 TaxID=3342285 RepID=UPI003ED01745
MSILLGIAALATAAPAAAQFWAPDQQTLFGMGMSQMGLQNMELSRQNLQAAMRKSPARATPAAPSRPQRPAGASLTFGSAGASQVTRLMAEAAPADRRKEYQQGLERLLDAHRQAAARLGLPRNDVSGALAHFLIGNYQALSGVQLTEPQIRTVVKQVVGALIEDPTFARASDQERQDLFERLAIVGVLMDTLSLPEARRRDPALAAKAREQAQAYLREALGPSGDQLVLTDVGFAMK